MRRQVLSDFAKYRAPRDTRNMDQICNAGASGTDFELQAHQKFLRDWVAVNAPKLRTLLLYHQIGSGKTCTSITMAMEWLRKHPKGRVRVVLPARLRTNFWDELLSPCTMNKYFSQQKYSAYVNAPTPAARKRLRAQLMEAVSKDFEVLSFDAMRRDAATAPSLKSWTDDFTRDTFLVVDEVHNMLSASYKDEMYSAMVSADRLTSTKSSTAMLFRYMVHNAHRRSKMVFLSATPVFDNAGQFVELVRILDPTFEVPRNRVAKLSEAIDHLRGKVSFFPGVSPSAYPAVEYEHHLLQATRDQDKALDVIAQKRRDNNEDDEDAFRLHERMIALVVMPPPSHPLKPSPAKLKAVAKNLKRFSPKIDLLMRIIDGRPGKHVVYSGFVAMGVDPVRTVLQSRGWVDIADVVAGRAKPKDYMTFAVWDGSTKDAAKDAIKAISNGVDNMDGRLLRVIIGSPSIKEGISFKHVQHLHMLDPVWNQSTKTQVEGRAIRFCSHSQVPVDHSTLARRVVVHTYCLEGTVDSDIYDRIIPEKQKNVATAEKALKRVALDYHLFRRLHEDGNTLRVSAVPAGKHSPVHMTYDGYIGRGAVKLAVKKASTCPKPRRPNSDNKCMAAGYTVRVNKQGFPCCYKERKSKNTQAA